MLSHRFDISVCCETKACVEAFVLNLRNRFHTLFYFNRAEILVVLFLKKKISCNNNAFNIKLNKSLSSKFKRVSLPTLMIDLLKF